MLILAIHQTPSLTQEKYEEQSPPDDNRADRQANGAHARCVTEPRQRGRARAPVLGMRAGRLSRPSAGLPTRRSTASCSPTSASLRPPKASDPRRRSRHGGACRRHPKGRRTRRARRSQTGSRRPSDEGAVADGCLERRFDRDRRAHRCAGAAGARFARGLPARAGHRRAQRPGTGEEAGDRSLPRSEAHSSPGRRQAAPPSTHPQVGVEWGLRPKDIEASREGARSWRATRRGRAFRALGRAASAPGRLATKRTRPPMKARGSRRLDMSRQTVVTESLAGRLRRRC